MKKINVYLMMFVLLVFGSTVSVYAQSDDIPDWYLNPAELYEEYGFDDVIIATAQAEYAYGSSAENGAIFEATSTLAREISYMVSELFDSFLSEKGYDPDRFFPFTRDLITELEQLEVRNTKVVRRYASRDRTTFYVAVIVNEKDALQDAIRRVSFSSKSEIFAEFANEYLKR